MSYLRDKGVPSAEEVKESDLGEDQIRTLRNDYLKTLIKWKKISSDAAIPTKKDTLVTRLMATMGRRSPQASPYNSDDEEYDEDTMPKEEPTPRERMKRWMKMTLERG